MRNTSSRGRPRGAVLIEFVIVLPVFLLLLLAAVDWGWYFVVRENVVNATREGARIGAAAPSAGAASLDATTAVTNYLRNSLGERFVRAPEVSFVSVAGRQAISVRLRDFPAGSITGFTPTHVPTTVTSTTIMRLEVQP
jgi:Flp pilus assembly protein TadG